MARAGKDDLPEALPDRPDYVLRQETLIERPLEELFDFFSRPTNLGAMTPPEMSFEILGQSTPELRAGTVLRYRIRLGPLPMGWVTLITDFERNRRFVDLQARGPYRLWWHEHRFEAEGEHTRMRDTVYYTLPAGPLGRLAHALTVRRTLERIFAYRHQAMARRFGARALPPAARTQAAQPASGSTTTAVP